MEYFHRNVFSYSALYRKHAPERTVKHFPSGLRDAKKDGNDNIFDKFIASGQGVNANDGLGAEEQPGEHAGDLHGLPQRLLDPRPRDKNLLFR